MSLRAGITILINIFFLTGVKFVIQEYSFGRLYISEYSWNGTWGYYWVMNEDIVSHLLDITVPCHLAICVWRIIITLGASVDNFTLFVRKRQLVNNSKMSNNLFDVVVDDPFLGTIIGLYWLDPQFPIIIETEIHTHDRHHTAV